jgi:hypothetical protein
MTTSLVVGALAAKLLTQPLRPDGPSYSPDVVTLTSPAGTVACGVLERREFTRVKRVAGAFACYNPLTGGVAGAVLDKKGRVYCQMQGFYDPLAGLDLSGCGF